MLEDVVKNTLIDNNWKNVVKTNESKSSVSTNTQKHIDITGSFEDDTYDIDVKIYNRLNDSIEKTSAPYVATIIDDKLYICPSSKATSKSDIEKNAKFTYDVKNYSSMEKNTYISGGKTDGASSWKTSNGADELQIAINAMIKGLGINGKLTVA